MLDLKFIRENAELVKQAVINKNESADIDKILELDEKRRAVIGEVEKLKALRNTVSEQIAVKKKNKEDASESIAQMKEVGQKIAELDKEFRSVKEALDYHMLRVPNLPDETVPVGPDEESNVTVREWGEIPKFDFKPLPHWEIGQNLGLLELAAAAKITGSGFYILKGAGARMQRALISLMLDTHGKDGYIEIAPPFLANADSMIGTGQLPKLADDMYQLKDENFYLIPTGEVPVSNLHRDEILDEEQLPLYYLVHPDTSQEEHETLLAQAEKIIRMLKIPYRVRLLATGDLSFAAAKCYDIEIWAAGVKKYLEISSVSNFLDFQARRMNTRFRNKDKKTQFIHTLNGSGVALARLIPAIIENYQTEYGSVVIPEAIRPYMGGQAEITSGE